MFNQIKIDRSINIWNIESRHGIDSMCWPDADLNFWTVVRMLKYAYIRPKEHYETIMRIKLTIRSKNSLQRFSQKKDILYVLRIEK